MKVLAFGAWWIAGLFPGFAQSGVDPGFAPELDTVGLNALAVQPDGKILISGSFSTVAGVPRDGLARLNPDGGVDLDFSPAVNRYITNLAVQTDGKIVIVGGDSVLGGVVMRLNPDGAVDSSFSPSVNNQVHCVAIQPDGKILIGGMFTTVNGVTRNRIARLDPSGALDSNFDPDANSWVESIVVQSDGKILIGGNFFDVGGTARGSLARLNPDGTVDPSVVITAGSWVRCIALQADGKILLGGDFKAIGGVPRNYLARLNSDGTLDTSFNPDLNEDITIVPLFVSSIVVQADGKITFSGRFTGVGGVTRRYIARVTASGDLDAGFDPDANSMVFATALQADGKVLMGGVFTTIGGTPQIGFARFLNDPAKEAFTVTSPGRIEWLRSGAAPETTHVMFDISTDGTSWTALGAGTRIAGGWELTGLNLPEVGVVRARARVAGGNLNGSSSLVASYVMITTDSAHAQVANLIAYVDGLSVHPGLEKSLLAQLEAAKKALTKNRLSAASSVLKAFVSHVKAQRGKKLSPVQADHMIADAMRILSQIGE